jgi:hypothetical protein
MTLGKSNMADHVANMCHPGSKQNISWRTYASAGANELTNFGFTDWSLLIIEISVKIALVEFPPSIFLYKTRLLWLWLYGIGSWTWLYGIGSWTWLYGIGSWTWLYGNGSWTWLYGIGSWTDIYSHNKSISPPKIVNLIPVLGQVYSTQFYEIKLVSWLWKVDGFLQQWTDRTPSRRHLAQVCILQRKN